MTSGASAPDRSRSESLRIEAWIGLVLLLAGLVLAGVGMSSDLEGPWQRGWKAHNGGRYAHIARNYARWGFAHAGGAPVLGVLPEPGQPAPSDDADVYAHHPPGVMMVTGLLFRLFGVSERTARLVSFVATLASLAVLARLVSAVAGPLAGGAAALLCGALPMTVVFGTHVEVQGPLVLLAGLTTLLTYRRWLSGGSLLPWLAASAVASWFDWFGLYYAAGCALHALLSGRGLPSTLKLAGWVTALFTGWLAWLSNLPGMSWRRVLGAAGVRVDGGSGAENVVFLDVLGDWWADSLGLMPVWPLLVALTLFLALGAGRSGSVSGARTRSTLLLLAAPPVVHSLLFPAGMLLHSYWLFALPAALAAGLGIGLARLNPVACLAGVLLAAAGFVGRVEPAREEIDLLPSLLGQAVASETRPGEGVLTNFEVNVLWDGMAVGEYIVIRPEVTFYADRPVRGGVRGRARDEAVDLAGARRLLPAARWFLLWPDPIGDPLLHDSLIALGGPEPELLSGEPPVLFFRLPP